MRRLGRTQQTKPYSWLVDNGNILETVISYQAASIGEYETSTTCREPGIAGLAARTTQRRHRTQIETGLSQATLPKLQPQLLAIPSVGSLRLVHSSCPERS